jgi:hypothetical protein
MPCSANTTYCLLTKLHYTYFIKLATELRCRVLVERNLPQLAWQTTTRHQWKVSSCLCVMVPNRCWLPDNGVDETKLRSCHTGFGPNPRRPTLQVLKGFQGFMIHCCITLACIHDNRSHTGWCDCVLVPSSAVASRSRILRPPRIRISRPLHRKTV